MTRFIMYFICFFIFSFSFHFYLVLMNLLGREGF